MNVLTDNQNIEYFTIEEVCNLARCSKKFVEKHRATGRFPGVTRVGGRYIYNAGQIIKRLQQGNLLLEKSK